MLKLERRKGEHVYTIDSLEIELLDIQQRHVVLLMKEAKCTRAECGLTKALADVCCNRGGHFWSSSAGCSAFLVKCEIGREVKLRDDDRLAVENIVGGVVTLAIRTPQAERRLQPLGLLA